MKFVAASLLLSLTGCVGIPIWNRTPLGERIPQPPERIIWQDKDAPPEGLDEV